MAAAVRERRAQRERRLGLRPVAALGVAVLRIERRAFEMIERDEVDDAGHRVRAVHGRGTAGDRLDAGQDRVRHQVDVDGAEDIRQRQTPAVEQHEITIRTQRMQIDGGVATGSLSAIARAARRRELRHLVERRFQRDRAALLQALDRRNHDRARRLAVRIGDQRSGDDHFLEPGFGPLRIVLGRVRDAEGQHRRDPDRQTLRRADSR